MSSNQEQDRFECERCQRTFKRPEHLTRHSKSHDPKPPFTCRHCRKDFYRNDVYKRHLNTHELVEPNLLKKRARACASCATARSRCSGLNPCSRCRDKDLPCEYPQVRRAEGRNAISNGSCEGEPPNSNSIQPEEDDVTPDIVIALSSSSNDVPRYHDTATAEDGDPDLTVVQSGSYAFNPDDEPPDLGSSTLMEDNNYMPRNNLTESEGINWLSFSPLPDEVYPEIPDAIDLDGLNVFQDHLYRASDMFGSWNFAHPLEQRQISDLPAVAANDRSLDPEMSVTSPTSVGDASKISGDSASYGEFYVDGEEGRLPRVKHRRARDKQRSNISNVFCTEYSFEAARDLPTHDAQPPNDNGNILTANEYIGLKDMFKDICLDVGPDSFKSSFFPTPLFLNHLIQLYWSSFSTILPCLHQAFLLNKNGRWLLLLALSAVGSTFLEVDGVEQLTMSLHELLRRVLLKVAEDPKYNTIPEIVVIQTTLLNCLGLMYSGNDRAQSFGLRTRSLLADFAVRASDYLAAIRSEDLINQTELADNETAWERWLEIETYRRTWYAIWLLDAMWKFHFQQRPLLSLENAVISVPCHESIWKASSAVDWKTLKDGYNVTPSLLSLLQDLYIEKKMSSDIGEYSRTLVIYGLFRRQWEVETYYRQPLSQWEPTAAKQLSANLGPPVPRWLPSIMAFRKWRNSACDCLDVLHWQANATIGSNANMEHPTVMHLHLARVILLAPHENILSLAKLRAASNSASRSSAQMARESHIIALWTQYDQYKSRLAIIHAGVLLWHVRRYSASAHYEAVSVALATLTLWAYAVFVRRDETDAMGPSDVASGPSIVAERSVTYPDDVEVLPLIHLDRPTDDELVQLFIRQGGTMHANLSGVGDIHSTEAPRRILMAGRRVLVELKHWGIASKCLAIIDGMLQSEQVV